MDKAEKAMTIVGPVIEKLVGMATMLIPLAIVVAIGYHGYKYAL
jgi:hypothetical protein